MKMKTTTKKNEKEHAMIQAWNADMDGQQATAHAMHAYVESLLEDDEDRTDDTVKHAMACAMADLVHAILHESAALPHGCSTVPWNEIAQRLALGYPEAEDWTNIVHAMKTAFTTYYPNRKWSGGFIQGVVHAGKKTRATKSKGNDARALNWTRAAKDIDALAAKLAKVKGPRKGKEYMDAKAKVILLAASMGLTIEG